ncbi:MAG: MFS transporter [Devosia ginsengisoli]|nr:MFS transporter [Devosia ginsengisoli]MCR6673051.1 MFS transporter [Devosia ginsengisoli]
MSQPAQSAAAPQSAAAAPQSQSASEEPQAQSVGLIIGAVAVTLLLASLGQTIVSTALPTIVSELGGLEHLTWVVIAYLLSSTVVAPIYGKLGDLYGRKIVLQAAIVIFLIGAGLSAFANSMNFLIFARTVQGLGGGGLMVVAMTVVADVIPRASAARSRAFSAPSSVSPLSSARCWAASSSNI